MSRATLTVGEHEVERHVVRFVEEELRLYSTRKQRVEFLTESIIRSTPTLEPGMPRAPGPGNPTLSRAVALMMDQERTHLKLWVMTVEETLARLTVVQKEIIRLSYFENELTPDGVAATLKMDRATLYRHRNPALLLFCIALIGDNVVRPTDATKLRLAGMQSGVN